MLALDITDKGVGWSHQKRPHDHPDVANYLMLSVVYFMTWPNRRNMRGENKVICMWIVYPRASKFHRSVQFPTREDMSKATVPFQLQGM